VDVIVAQGMESGGHVRGQVGRLPLLPTVVEAVAPTPVLAAGGIVHGRGLAAALSLGAEGVWVGPRFVASAESEAHEDTIRGLPARLA
jgi:nitronate monooxygenase